MGGVILEKFSERNQNKERGRGSGSAVYEKAFS